MDDDTRMLVLFAATVIFFVVSVALLFAQLRLFSIDRTLKEIRDELRATREKEVAAGAPRQAGVPRTLG